jgi:hypothetical protein
MIEMAVEKARQFLMRRRHNYRLTFLAPPGQEVLRDLATFCRANETTFHADARLHAVAEGRREVWLRIANHLNMPPDDLWVLYTRRDDVQG